MSADVSPAAARSRPRCSRKIPTIASSLAARVSASPASSCAIRRSPLSGLLVPKIGGPSVKPYMPDGVWDETSKYGDLRGYKADSGEGLYRRSLYTIWKRTAAPPTMLLFDAPSREVCTVKRSRTNTPLQALALLNEVTFVEAARSLAATPHEGRRCHG
jgi:hypothetical protein